MSLIKTTALGARDTLRSLSLGKEVSQDELWMQTQALDHLLELLETDKGDHDYFDTMASEVALLAAYKGAIEFLKMKINTCTTDDTVHSLMMVCQFLERCDEDYKQKQLSRRSSKSGGE